MQSPSKKRMDQVDLAQFLGMSTIRRFSQGQTLIIADEVPDSIHYLVNGSVEVVMENEDGKELVLAFLNEGHFFGEMGFFGHATNRTAWVRARSDSVVAELSYDKFAEFSSSNAGLLFEVATQLSVRLARTNSRVSNLVFLSVSGRVAKVLLELAEEPEAIDVEGGRVIKYTQPQLARIVGCSREMISRVLKMLQMQGLISVDKGITVFGSFAKEVEHTSMEA